MSVKHIHVSIKGVEPVLVRIVQWRWMPNPPLADAGRFIAVLLQDVSHRSLRESGFTIAADRAIASVQSRHQDAARRSADRRPRIVPRKTDSLSSPYLNEGLVESSTGFQSVSSQARCLCLELGLLLDI